MKKIGIGITTRNRPESILECVNNIKLYSTIDELIVVDDASTIPVSINGTRVHRFNKQHGIAKSKNKCLSYLDNCDYIFLLDDDCWPIKDGWQDAYINNSVESGCNHFCFTWDNYKLGSYFEILERFKKQKIVLSIEGLEDEFMDDYMHDTLVRIKKVRAGLPAETPYTQHTRGFYDIKSHRHPHGVMMFITNEVLKKVGGFNTAYKIYGCEHGGFSNRIYNSGLNPLGVYLDINNSDQYFYAKDKMCDADKRNCTVSDDIIDKYREFNEKIFEEEKLTSDYFSYK